MAIERFRINVDRYIVIRNAHEASIQTDRAPAILLRSVHPFYPEAEDRKLHHLSAMCV